MSEVATPGSPRTPAEDAPHARVPGGEFTFKDRARRLHALAAGHALSGYLEFMARVVEAQAHAAHALAGRVTAASADHIAGCIAEGRPVYPNRPTSHAGRRPVDRAGGRLRWRVDR